MAPFYNVVSLNTHSTYRYTMYRSSSLLVLLHSFSLKPHSPSLSLCVGSRFPLKNNCKSYKIGETVHMVVCCLTLSGFNYILLGKVSNDLRAASPINLKSNYSDTFAVIFFA